MIFKGSDAASTFVGSEMFLQYTSGRDSLQRDKLDRAFISGLGPRDSDGGFGLEETDDSSSWGWFITSRESGWHRDLWDSFVDSKLLAGDWEGSSDKIVSGRDWENPGCSDSRDEFEPF